MDSNEQWLHINNEMRKAFPRKCGEGAASDRKHDLTSLSSLATRHLGREVNKKMGRLRRSSENNNAEPFLPNCLPARSNASK